MSFNIGENVGAYRIIEQLGSGGMASVYKAYHAALDRYVAIKVMHPAFLEDANFLARFTREARLVARLEHPHIVPIYDFSEHSGRPYLVMKYIEGETLKTRMQRGSLTTSEILSIVESIGSALQYAHQQNILHRDIKPSNVLLSSDGQIYLADFGLARMAQGSSSTLTSDMLIGTPQYISPEQAMSKPDLDARTDIYSFGIMVFELLVGRVPFNADTPFATIHDHIYTPIPLPRQVNPQVSEAMERVLLKTLAKNPADRYASVNEMVQAFRMAAAPIIRSETTTVIDPPPATEVNVPHTTTPIPASATSAVPTLPPTAPANKKSSRFSGWQIAIFILVIGAIGISTLLGGSYLFNRWRQSTAPKVTPTTLASPQSVPARTRPAPMPAGSAQSGQLPSEIKQPLDAAIEAYRKGDMQGATQGIKRAEAAIANNNDMMLQAMEYLRSKDTILLAAYLGMPNAERLISGPGANAWDAIVEFRGILYLAAEDPLAGDFFERYKGTTFTSIARARYEWYFGNKDKSKSLLNETINKLGGYVRFPEARLLEAEIANQENQKDKANKLLGDLLAAPNVPQWIKTAAEEMKQIFTKP